MIENENLSELSPEKVNDMLGPYCDGLSQIWGRNSGATKLSSAPTNAGTYTVKINVAQDTNLLCSIRFN